MCFTLGSGMFTWQTQKQDTIAQSTAEAEYMALSSATNHAVWLKRLLGKLKVDNEKGVPIYCDNTFAIPIGRNPVQHRRTKHIQIRYHIVREAEREGVIDLRYCSGEEQIADILTKPLNTKRFEELCSKLGVTPNPNEEKRIEGDDAQVSSVESNLHMKKSNQGKEIREKQRDTKVKILSEKEMSPTQVRGGCENKSMRENVSLHVSYADAVRGANGKS